MNVVGKAMLNPWRDGLCSVRAMDGSGRAGKTELAPPGCVVEVSPSPTLMIVTGERGAGKTSWCSHHVQVWRDEGLTVQGLLSPGRFELGRKTGIFTRDLAMGEERLLAEATGAEEGCRWCFDESTLAWGNACLQATRACHTLLVDEVGPLELNLGRGWVSVWEVLAHGTFQRVVLVVRPSLVKAAQQRLQAIFNIAAEVYEVRSTS